MDRSLAFATYLAISMGLGVVMAKLIERPVLRVRERLFPRMGLRGDPGVHRGFATTSSRVRAPYTGRMLKKVGGT
jgi:peptidoglycan/LPS O-acetylase OafA/YrhL